ncbi:MAG TPA: hypothetical protein VFZ34_00660, partial [Blastocatellia bacterium]|nr:hypothetical protein [Blastocatellia bacterium]
MKKICCVVLIAFFLLMFTNSSVRAAEVVLLPLPFENVSGQPEYHWVGESFAVIMADLLDSPGLVVLSPDERGGICERAGLRPCDSLTLAAKLRLAEAAQANLLLIGTYEVTGEKNAATVAFAAKLVETREGRVAGKSFNFSGPLSDLQTLQGLLAWSILY